MPAEYQELGASVQERREGKEALNKRMLFIDDSPVFLEVARKGVEEDFTGTENVQYFECGGSDKERKQIIDRAMKFIEDNNPEVIFLDNSLATPPDCEGLEIAKLVQDRWPNIEIISTTTDEEYIKLYAALGIGHVDKKSHKDLMNAVREANSD